MPQHGTCSRTPGSGSRQTAKVPRTSQQNNAQAQRHYGVGAELRTRQKRGNAPDMRTDPLNRHAVLRAERNNRRNRNTTHSAQQKNGSNSNRGA
jgi:hypothetical protein